MMHAMDNTDGTMIADPSSIAASQERVASVDALRGLVILLMIFVNDVAGVGRAPSWLKHVGVDADAMTLPDIVFPAFLFIAGMSIPLSLQRASASGQTKARLVLKVLARTFALLVMGVMMVNGESHNPWYRGSWGLLAYPGHDPGIHVAASRAWLAGERHGSWLG